MPEKGRNGGCVELVAWTTARASCQEQQSTGEALAETVDLLSIRRCAVAVLSFSLCCRGRDLSSVTIRGLHRGGQPIALDTVLSSTLNLRLNCISPSPAED